MTVWLLLTDLLGWVDDDLFLVLISALSFLKLNKQPNKKLLMSGYAP